MLMFILLCFDTKESAWRHFNIVRSLDGLCQIQNLATFPFSNLPFKKNWNPPCWHDGRGLDYHGLPLLASGCHSPAHRQLLLLTKKIINWLINIMIIICLKLQLHIWFWLTTKPTFYNSESFHDDFFFMRTASWLSNAELWVGVE